MDAGARAGRRRQRRVGAPSLMLVASIGGFTAHPAAAVLRHMFVTKETGPGDLGSWTLVDNGATGLNAGDVICTRSAQAANLATAGPGSTPVFRAWLSTSTT